MRDLSLTLTGVSVSLLAVIAPVRAQLPYNPNRILVADNHSVAYIFSPDTSYQASLSTVNLSRGIAASDTPSTLFTTLPFLSNTSPKSFIPISDDGGIKVLSGSCSESAESVQLWQLTPDHDYKNASWTELKIQADDSSISANFLSVGVSFYPTTDSENALLYVFGGMCPSSTSLNATDWVSQSNYSDGLIRIQAGTGSGQSATYDLSITSSTDTESFPIAEAGMTMTPLTPWFSNVSSGSVSQQQDFVLLGGHTQEAFINMSQVAVFSLPQSSWTFVTVQQPQSSSVSTELTIRGETQVEPRSGHTAVLTEDGTQIIVLGGWVGDISTPAQPQLAILRIDQTYGGVGTWQWDVPDDTSNPYSAAGVYGHAAAMLPGGVMMVAGGRHISTSSSSRIKRDTTYQDSAFFNTSSMTWSSSYVNPLSQSSGAGQSGSSHSSSSKKALDIGLGVGLGVGLAALILALAICLWFFHRRGKERADRERRLRKQALGTDKDLSSSVDRLGLDSHCQTERRTASWHNMQERQIESSHASNMFSCWDPISSQNHQRPTLEMDLDNGGIRQAERTGAMMEVPSPTRGLRKNVVSRAGLAAVPGAVFRIDEEEENSQTGSIRLVRGASVYSDPFKDPVHMAEVFKPDEAAERRKRELQGWAEDWQSAVESLNLSRNPSGATQGRTYSSISQPHSSGRGSPEKSDRTSSNISERSADLHMSLQRGVIDRSLSQKSVTAAGYSLFSGAASAMGRLTGSRNTRPHTAEAGMASALSRAPSNRSVSLNMPSSTGPAVRKRERADTLSSAQSAFGPALAPDEDHDLLGKIIETPPESPTKDKGEAKHGRTGSLTRTGVKAIGLLGSVKRVFVGTGGVDVADRVASIEQGSSQSSPTKSQQSGMVEILPRRSFSTDQAFLRGRRGAKDWADELQGEPSMTEPLRSHSSSAAAAAGASVPVAGVIRRKPVPGQSVPEPEPEPEPREEPKSDDEWDIETAVQRRVVQVMFTVPKEKLRVVNADSLSLLSSNRSDIDHDDDQEREREISRMTSLREGDEDEPGPKSDKGKQPVRD